MPECETTLRSGCRKFLIGVPWWGRACILDCLLLAALVSGGARTCIAAECLSSREGNWSEATAWVDGRVPQAAADTVVITHKISVDADISLAGCRIEKGGELLIPAGKSLTVGERLDIQPGGVLINNGGTLKPARERFALNVGGAVSASGMTRIRNCDIVFDSDQKLSSLYSQTPAEDQLSNTWSIGKDRTLTMDTDAWVTSIRFNITGNGTASLVIDATGTGKPLTLRFADVAGCGIKPLGTVRCKGSLEYPIIITSVSSSPKNYFYLQGETNRSGFEMGYTRISFSKGLTATRYYGSVDLKNCDILSTEPGQPALSLIGAAGKLADVTIRGCTTGISISPVYGRDITASNLNIEECSGQSIELNPGKKPAVFFLKDSRFASDRVGLEGENRLVSTRHDGETGCLMIGAYTLPSIQLSKIPKEFRFGPQDNLELRMIRLLLDDKAECNNLTMDALSGLEGKENLTVRGGTAVAERGNKALLCLSLDEGKGDVAYNKGLRNVPGKINNGSWVKGMPSTTNEKDVTDPFLVLYWPMDEDRGNRLRNCALKESTQREGILSQAQWTEGKFGSGLKLSRVPGSRIYIPSAGPYIDRSLRHGMSFQYGLSQEMWLSFSDLENQDISLLPGCVVRLKGKSILVNDKDTGFSPALNNWHHLAVCSDYTKNKMLVYVDGKVVKEVALTGNSANINLRDYTAVNLGNGTFNGLLDDFRLYSRPLEAAEVQAHFQGREIIPPYIKEVECKAVAGVMQDNSVQALEFDGKDTYIRLPGLAQTGELTLSAWIYTDIPYRDSSIFEQTDQNTVGLRFGIDEGRLVAAFSRDKSESIQHVYSMITDNAVIEKSKWYHIAFTYSVGSKTSAMYLNGLKVKEMMVETPVCLTGKTLVISGMTTYPTSYRQFSGFIRQIEVYPYALTTEGMLQSYLQSSAKVRGYRFMTQEESVEAESNCRITGRIVDSKTDTPLVAQLYVSAGGRYYISKDRCYWGSSGSEKPAAFIGAGDFRVNVPSGRVTIRVSKGFEYFPAEVNLDLKEGEKKEIVIELKRMVDMPALKWYAGEHHAHSWGHGKGVLFDKLASGNGWRHYADVQQAAGFNYVSHSAPWDGGDCKSTWSEQFICSPTVEDQICHIHAGHVQGNRNMVARLESLAKAGGHGLVQGYGGDDLQPGQVAVAMALGKIDGWQVNEEDWFRYLNMGFKSCVGHGSDYYFDYGVRKIAKKEYARMRNLTWQDMIESYRKHATFVTDGPLVMFNVNGLEAGEDVVLAGKGATTLQCSISVWHIYGLLKLEVIRNGRVEKTFTYNNKPVSVNEVFTFQVQDSGWLLVKVYAEKGEFAAGNALTSPVYLQYGDNPLKATGEDVDHFIEYIRKYREYLKGNPVGHLNPEKEDEDAVKAIGIYRDLLNKPRTWLDGESG